MLVFYAILPIFMHIISEEMRKELKLAKFGHIWPIRNAPKYLTYLKRQQPIMNVRKLYPFACSNQSKFESADFEFTFLAIF